MTVAQHLLFGPQQAAMAAGFPVLGNLVKQSFTNGSSSLALPGMSLVKGVDDVAARAYFVMATRHASIFRSVSSIGFIDVTEWGGLTWAVLAGAQATEGGWKCTHDLWISSPLPSLSGNKTGTLQFNLSGSTPQILAMAGIITGLDEARGSFGSDGFAAQTPSSSSTMNFNTTYAKKYTLTLNSLLQIDDVSTTPTASPSQSLIDSVAQTNMLLRLYALQKETLSTESFSYTGGSGERMATTYKALGGDDGVTVTPGSSTFDSGSGNFTVPAYNTLTIEVWGGGASGAGRNGSTGLVAGNNGGTSSAGSISCTGGGAGPAYTNTSPGGAAGTASGGNTTNTNGNAGGGDHSGFGAACPNGGAQVNCNTGTVTQASGNAPGGGGPGSITQGLVAMAGGGSGAYSKTVYTETTSGAPSIGALIAWAVGAGGASTGSTAKSGAGGAGRVKFTWS